MVIAQILGVFFVIVGISIVANSKGTVSAIEASVQDKGTLWLWGMLALLIGTVVVVFNNLWTSGMPLLITVIGWIALVKGTFIMIFPDAAVSLYKRFNKAGILIFCGVIAFVLGLVLLYW